MENGAEPHPPEEFIETPETSVSKIAADGDIELPELKVQENDFVKQAIEKLPEVVLPHVVIAAEQNKPIEALYERRHEVKDEASQPVTPISSVLASMQSAVVPENPIASIERLTQEEQSSDQKSVVRAPQPGYKQAILKGFTFGLTIIIFVALYLLIK